MVKTIRKVIHFFQFEAWKSVHSLSLKEIKYWQDKKLLPLLKHAYTNVPMYKNHWGEEVKNLKLLPTVSKKIFLTYPVEERVGIQKPQNYTWRNTSGTSGQPFSFITTKNRSSPYSALLTYRFLYWLGFTVKDIQKNIVIVKISAVTSEETYNNRTYLPVKDFLLNKKETVRKIENINPLVLESYPSILLAIAEEVYNLKLSNDLNIKYAISYGENLTPYQRIQIEKKLNCKVFNRYGLEEVGVIGSECTEHDGFHINDETFILEIIDDSGTEVTPGELGKVIITDLSNYAMPFIRYDTGDRGYLVLKKCACGLAGLKLKIEGRHGAFLNLESGDVHHLDIDKVMESFSDAIIQYQVVKVNNNHIIVRIIPGLSMNDFIVSFIKNKLEKLTGNTCLIEIKFVTEIKATPSGKSQTVIS